MAGYMKLKLTVNTKHLHLRGDCTVTQFPQPYYSNISQMWQQTALIIGTKESSRELFIVLFQLQLECSVGVFIKNTKTRLDLS